MSDNFQVNKQFARFKGKDVLIGLFKLSFR